MAIDTAAVSLAAALRDSTAMLHRRAERAGITAELLAGRATRDGYALLLRNLLPAYTTLECIVQRDPAAAAVVPPALFRAPAIAADLLHLCGPDWAARLAVLPAGARYAHRIASADLARLIAHAYVRYLGDLSGGQVVARLLARSLALPPAGLTFYQFPAIGDLAAAKAAFRAALDAAAEQLDRRAVLAEAAVAFRLSIALAEAVQGAAG